MTLGKVFSICLLGLCCVFSTPTLAKEKLVYYAAGALTISENTCLRQIDYNSNCKYKIKLGFINYSDSTLILNYRDGSSEFKTVALETRGQCCDLITVNSLQSGSFAFEIRANFLDSKSNFVSYDILLIEED